MMSVTSEIKPFEVVFWRCAYRLPPLNWEILTDGWYFRKIDCMGFFSLKE